MERSIRGAVPAIDVSMELAAPTFDVITDLDRPVESYGTHRRRNFVEQVGEPIGHFRLRIRLEYAAGLLSSSEEPIKCIAAQIGYGSPEAFATAFRNRYGQSPSEFRQRNRGGLRLMPGFLFRKGVPIDRLPTAVRTIGPGGLTITYTYNGLRMTGMVLPNSPGKGL